MSSKIQSTKTTVSRRTIFLWLLGIILAEALASGTTWQKVSSALQVLGSTIPTPPPVFRLNPDPVGLTVNTNSTKLLDKDSTTVKNVQQQIDTQIQQQKIHQSTAGIVETAGGGTNANRGLEVAQQVNTILKETSGQNIVFNSNTVFNKFFDVSKPDGTIAINIYVFSYTPPIPTPTPPTPTSTPPAGPGLNPQPIDVMIKKANSDELLAGDNATVTDIQQQINTQLQQQNSHHQTVGFVTTFGGGPDANRDAQIAHKINSILQETSEQNIVFNSNTVFKDYIDLGKPDGTITIEIYVFL